MFGAMRRKGIVLAARTADSYRVDVLSPMSKDSRVLQTSHDRGDRPRREARRPADLAAIHLSCRLDEHGAKHELSGLSHPDVRWLHLLNVTLSIARV